MFSVLLTTFLACNGSDKTGNDSTSTCTATFTFSFPNSGTVDIDFCARHDLEAQFEFDPDDPPEIRQPVMTFYSTLDEGFECTLTISESSACGVGYYLMDGSSGITTTTTLDCENVPDEYEGSFSSNGGYLQVTNVDTGTQTGNFTGTPLRTTIEGYLNVTTIEGIGITGSFSLSEDIVAEDAEEVECITNDGDIDNDGDIATVFGGTDCNDNDPNIEGLDSDNDGVSLCDGDCDDDDPTTYPSATEICDYKDNDCDNQIDETALGTFFLDSDNDGYGDPTASTEDCSAPGNYVENNLDCNDNNPQLNQDDDDNDGSSTCDGDCNDNDSTLNLLDEDGDGVSTCDGDCDDADGTVNPLDVDGDGFSTCDGDCDDDNSAFYGQQGSDTCPYFSCLEILQQFPNSSDGLYWIAPSNQGPVETHCDMTTEGGGWTVISSFDIAYREEYKNKPFHSIGFPRNDTNFNWDDFRLKRDPIINLIASSTEVHARCHRDFSSSNYDWFYGDVSLIASDWGGIDTFSHTVNPHNIRSEIRGYSSEDYNFRWVHGGNDTWHAAVESSRTDLPGHLPSEDSFGYHNGQLNPQHPCHTSAGEHVWMVR